MQTEQTPRKTAAVAKVPHSPEAEQSLLGGLLVDPEAVNKVAGSVTPEDFYSSKHRAIFQAVLDLYEKDTPVDLVTVSTALTDKDQLTAIGGLAYLSSLVDTMPSSTGIEAYAGIVREKSIMRSVMNAAAQIQTMGFEEHEIGAKEYLDRAEMLIFSINGDRERKKGFVPVGDFAHGTIRIIEELFQRKRDITGVPSGFIDLDRLTSGFQPGNLIIIAGRPSMGKTSIALNISQYLSLMMSDPVPVGIFSMEMSKEEIFQRVLSSEAEIDLLAVRSGTFAAQMWPRITETAAKISGAPIYIDDAPALNIMEVRGRARRLKKEHNIGLLVIDYLQPMRGRSGGGDRREQEISEISRFLKALAKELNIPVVALSQLNREVDKRDSNHRPRLSDLRESGAIEQDADVILFLYRDEVYNQGPDNPEAGIAEVIVAKQRNGPTGTAKLKWAAEIATFRNLYRWGHSEEAA